MTLDYIKISNFHGVENCEINIHEFTTIIGQNNCGKSTIIRAIDVVLNQIKPEPDEWRRGFEDSPIEIEVVFGNIADWERNIQGISGLVYDNKIRLKYIAVIEDGKPSFNYEAYLREEDVIGWDSSWRNLSDDIKGIAANIGVDNGTKFRNKSNQERILQIIRDQRPELISLGEERWTSESISIKPALKQGLPQVVFIPAVKDASDELKGTAKSTFKILLSKLILPAIEETQEYKDVMTAVETLTVKLGSADPEQKIEAIDSLMGEISDRLTTIISAKAILTMNSPNTGKLVGDNAIIKLDDGTETSVNHQGHGMQRSFLFAMIETLANRESTNIGTDDQHVRSLILLFEEPELYLHPHLMRRLKAALKNISTSPNWQVLISTHSPVLVNVVDKPESLVIMSKGASNAPPTIKQLESDPFLKEELRDEREVLRASLDFHPTVNEAFFAKRVVLVEGDTELALFHHVRKPHIKFNITDEEFDHTTIISCGGKWTIAPIATLLNYFSIPFRIIHDIDRKGRTDDVLGECRPIDPYNANSKIELHAAGNPIYQVDDTFEHVLWDRNQPIPTSKGKPYGTWKKIDDYLNDDHEGTIHSEDILKEIFEFTYKW